MKLDWATLALQPWYTEANKDAFVRDPDLTGMLTVGSLYNLNQTMSRIENLLGELVEPIRQESRREKDEDIIKRTEAESAAKSAIMRFCGVGDWTDIPQPARRVASAMLNRVWRTGVDDVSGSDLSAYDVTRLRGIGKVGANAWREYVDSIVRTN